MDEQTKSLIEAISSSPSGTFKLFRSTEGEPEVEKSMQNMNELVKRITHARNVGCLIEVISLRMQYLDVWLRIFFENVPHSDKREREFGRLLKQCFKVGLNKNLYDRIYNFNKHRVNSIHGFLLGITTYEEMNAVLNESDGLSRELPEFVIANSGDIVTEEFANEHHNRGDMVYHIPNLLKHLRERPPI